MRDTSTRTKGWRLAQRERKIAKRKHYFNYRWRGPEFKYGKLHKTVTPCSCDMCSHDRRHYGPTLKERATADLRPEVAEWYASADDAWNRMCEDMDMSYDSRVSLVYEE